MTTFILISIKRAHLKNHKKPFVMKTSMSSNLVVYNRMLFLYWIQIIIINRCSTKHCKKKFKKYNKKYCKKKRYWSSMIILNLKFKLLYTCFVFDFAIWLISTENNFFHGPFHIPLQYIRQLLSTVLTSPWCSSSTVGKTCKNKFK